MRVLVACEFSGIVREAFRCRGHDAWSCDLLPSEQPGPHLLGDVRTWLADGWDLVIAHPPCTFLSSSGLHWNGRIPGRQLLTDAAVDFARELLDCPAPAVCVENPVGRLSSALRRPDQIVQPWQFGDDASKATCLWLRGLPVLLPVCAVPGRVVNGRMRWANQTDSGQNRLSPGVDRWRDRSRTYRGIAAAMAQQWG